MFGFLSCIGSVQVCFLIVNVAGNTSETWWLFIGKWIFTIGYRYGGLTSLYLEIEGHELQLINAWPIFGNVSPTELIVLCLLCRALRARQILEIGTFDANTAINIALNLPPEGRVFILDLPPIEQAARSVTEPDWAWKQSIPGTRRPVPTHIAGKISFLVGDSKDFDFLPFFNSMDMVFIDGSHQYEDVRLDSQKALRCLRAGGMIIWNDAAPSKQGVCKAIRGLNECSPCRTQGTTLASGERLGEMSWRARST